MENYIVQKAVGSQLFLSEKRPKNLVGMYCVSAPVI